MYSFRSRFMADTGISPLAEREMRMITRHDLVMSSGELITV
jgi:hypothetical protein